MSSTPKVTVDRSRQLSVLAATEAGFIKDPDSRLTRQLNIADQVQQRYGPEDALAVLEQASTTMREVGQTLDAHTRISGWVSISQLARKAMGTQVAEGATRSAKRELEALPDVGERCQYVLGVAEELGQLQGDVEAVALLTQGGEWATGISDTTERRAARLAFAIALFNLNAYQGGVASLRGEDDATWSSDAMLAIASRDTAAATRDERSATAEVMQVPAMPTAPSQLGATNGRSSDSYGKALGYERVFRGQNNARH